ncbi:MAG: extracellular solute-binding protein [Ruminococcaceae bacterium]|nr:extracellular solute-binding protein [Oscillospiraceae bacterium]
MKRTLSLILAALSLAGILASAACSNSAPTDDTTDTTADTTAPAETTTAEPETTADPLADNLPDDVSYDGYAFRIGAISADLQWIKYLIRTEQTGEVLNDTIYEANNAVAERFGITFKHIPYSGTNYSSYNEILASARAGDDNVDILTLHDLRSGQAALQGVFRNVYDLEHVDFEKPWWPRFTTNALTINGKMYNISNSMSYYNIYAVRCLMFNKGLMKNLGITFPYDDVRAGTWYFDDLINMTKDVYSDVDNNGARSTADRYGIAITGTAYCFLECFGVDVYGRDDKGLIKDDFYNERTVNIVEKSNSWFNGGSKGAYFSASGDALKMFAGGNVLFAFRGLGQIVDACMDSDVEYGVLPMPKLDENQKEYISGTVDNPISVPITNKNMDRTGMIIEAMSAEGYRRVQPAYMETVMKNRYASDKDSVEMMDLVFNNRMLSAGYLFANSDKTYRLQTVHDDMWRQGSSNINLTSHYESVKGQFQGYINTINEFFSRTDE